MFFHETMEDQKMQIQNDLKILTRVENIHKINFFINYIYASGKSIISKLRSTDS